MNCSADQMRANSSHCARTHHVRSFSRTRARSRTGSMASTPLGGGGAHALPIDATEEATLTNT
jgi:hypothetical protein